jgi:uncharacterized protein (TIGR03083 family)
MSNDAPVLTAHLFGELHARLIELLRALPPQAWDAPTSAGAWRVRDVVAHMLDGDLRRIGVDRDGHTPPPPAGPMAGYAGLVTWLNALNAEWVAAARRISPRMLIELLEVTGPEVAGIMASHDPAAEATFPVAWAGHEASPMWLDIGREFTERWHHQDQIRAATGATPLVAPDLLHPVIAVSLHALPAAYAQVRPGPGTRIEIVVTGAAGGSWTLVQGEAAWLLEGGADGALMTGVGDGAACRITAPDLITARLLLHRLRPAEAAAQVRVDGDAVLAAPLLGARAVMV